MQGGAWRGQQLLNAQWVQDATRFADGKAWHATQVPRKVKTQELLGFGYHWWPLEGDRGDFTALGIRGQSIYVSPRQNVVVVQCGGRQGSGAQQGQCHGQAAPGQALGCKWLVHGTLL